MNRVSQRIVIHNNRALNVALFTATFFPARKCVTTEFQIKTRLVYARMPNVGSIWNQADDLWVCLIPFERELEFWNNSASLFVTKKNSSYRGNDCLYRRKVYENASYAELHLLNEAFTCTKQRRDEWIFEQINRLIDYRTIDVAALALTDLLRIQMLFLLPETKILWLSNIMF